MDPYSFIEVDRSFRGADSHDWSGSRIEAVSNSKTVVHSYEIAGGSIPECCRI
jgi:hypothetical protein